MDRLLWMIALAALLAIAGCDWGGEPDYPPVPTIDRVELSFESVDEPGAPQVIVAERASDGRFRRNDTLAVEPGEYFVGLGLYEDGKRVTQYLYERPEEPVLRYSLHGELPGHIRFDTLFPQLAPIDSDEQPAAYAAKTSPLPPPGFVVRLDTVDAEGTLHLTLERYDDFPPLDEQTAPLGTDLDALFWLSIVPDAAP